MNPKASTPVPAEIAVPPWSRRAAWGLAGLVSVFAAARWVGMNCDLWLDEVWSLGLAHSVTAPWEILTKVQHDNNHPLNTLWLHLLPPMGPAWTFRLLAWVAGSLTVLLAGLVARRQYLRLHPGAAAAAEAAGLLTATLAGGCHLLVHYASEARGYAPAVAAALLALYALLRADERAAGRWAVVYGLACMLGLLSHLVMAPVMAAGLAWAAAAAFARRAAWRSALGRMLAWHAALWLFFIAYYLGFVRRLAIGGGPDNPLAAVLGDTAAFTLGFPAEAGPALALPVLLVIVAVALGLLWRRDRGLAGFYLLAALVLPAAGSGLGRFQLLFPRYFVVSAALAVLLAGYLLARLWTRGTAARLVVAVGLGLFLVGNTAQLVRLGREGRGQYRAALQYLVANTPAPGVTLTADADFRNRPVISYHAAVAGLGGKIRYYPEDHLPRSGTHWRLVHRLDYGPAPGEAVTDARGNRYVLQRVFTHAPLSGWDWYAYRRVEPPER